MLYGPPQGNIFGGLLFNIDLCDSFLIMTSQDVANHADDNTTNVCRKNIGEIITLLEELLCCCFFQMPYQNSFRTK